MDGIMRVKELCANVFERTKTKVSNAFYAYSVRKKLKKHVRNMPRLSSEQKKAVKDFWRPYCRVSTDWARYYTYVTGKFDPRYIPDDLPLRKIDQYFNQWKMYGFTDKNNYSLIFPGIKQPTTVVRKIGDLLFDEEYRLIDLKKAEDLLSMRPEVIVKPTMGSSGGKDIMFFDTKTEIDEIKRILSDKDKTHIIIQDIVKQHHELAKMHPQSLNTVRIFTLMMEDGVHILSAALRMGANGSHIDNATSNSGIFTAILR